MAGFESPNYTQVPNDLFDMLPDMTDAEIRVTLIMIRETVGYHRDAAKVGMAELARRAGLSYNGAVAGCQSASIRGTFKRTNPDAKTQAEWELNIKTPSASEGKKSKHPQPVRESPSASEGQVGLNKVKEIKTESIKNIVSALQKSGIFSSTMTGEYVSTWLDEHNEDWIIKAIEKSRGKNLKYVDRVLLDWKANGYPKTRQEQIAAAKRQPESRRGPAIRSLD